MSWTKKGFFIELPSPDLIASLDALAFCKKKVQQQKNKNTKKEKLTQQNIWTKKTTSEDSNYMEQCNPHSVCFL